jgi:hypothetical protein
MGVGPIPWSAVERYAKVNELDDEETEDLHYLIQRMDSEFLGFQEEQMKAKRRS